MYLQNELVGGWSTAAWHLPEGSWDPSVVLGVIVRVTPSWVAGTPVRV